MAKCDLFLSVGFATYIRPHTSTDTNVYMYIGSNIFLYIHILLIIAK